MATVSIINVQQMFFFFPQFDEGTLTYGETIEWMNALNSNSKSTASLDFVETHKGVFTIGELLTISQPLSRPATAFTGSILVVTGAKDL